MNIRLLNECDIENIYALTREEGDDWIDYWGSDKYKKALQNCIVYVAYDGDTLCGYVRCRDDDGFGIYIYDLLVKPSKRGNSVGKKLMERVYADYPETTVYVMSGVDGYYEKVKYEKVGSIYCVKPAN